MNNLNDDKSQLAITPNFLVTSVIKCLDSRMKRLVYITSLAAVIRNNKDLDNQILDKMNSVLNLANAELKSLKLPALVCDKIWTNQSVIEDDIKYLKENNTSSKSCIDKVKNIINHTPKWLIYDTEEKVLDDIVNLFCLHKEVFATK